MIDRQNVADLDSVVAALTTGYAGGAWNGPGIDSPDAAAAGFALGYADDSAGTITVKYTRAGDADLDGSVGFSDLLKLAQSYNASADATWGQGDFNYDGAVNFADLLILTQNYNQHVASPLGRRQFIARHR